MYWYAAEPLAEADPDRALTFGLNCGKTIPMLREFMMRRIGSLHENAGLASLVSALGKSSDADEQLTFLRSLNTSLAGQRHVKPPKAWDTVYGKLVESNREDIRNEATALGVTFGDAAAFESLRTLVPRRKPTPRHAVTPSKRFWRPRTRHWSQHCKPFLPSRHCAMPRSPDWHCTMILTLRRKYWRPTSRSPLPKNAPHWQR